MKKYVLSTALLTLAAILTLPSAGLAQRAGPAEDKLTGFWLTTPYPELAIEPGETESISLVLRNEGLPPRRAALEVSGVPEGWEWALKGGGREVTAAIVAPDSTERLSLELTPPAKADTAGEHRLEIVADTGGETVTLPLVVRLSESAGGALELEPELPALLGSASSTFTFKVEATNGGAEDGLFNLAADVPQGFRTRFKKGYGSEEITGVPIAAGESETITMEVIPAPNAPAGKYPVTMRVAGGDMSAATELSMEITGEPEIRIVGPGDRLSGEASAGRESSFTFTFVNSGSAPATDLELSATSPNDWTVEFEPEEIATIAPNSTTEVAVRITPSERAVAGDYMVTLRASGGPVSESVDFRTTVTTSTVWGVVGVGVIAAAALVLGGAVMRYGRR